MSFNGEPNTPLSARKAGVRTARDATGGDRGEPQKVLGVVEATVMFVFYNDEKGEQQQAMYFKVGDQIVSTKDTVSWCKQLFPMNDWMRKQIDNKAVAEAPVEVPSNDAVDVMEP